MKKIFINTTTSILSIILILSFASCSKEISENEVTEGSSQKIRITGVGANTITKTTLDGLITSWNAGDKVGIYSPDARPTASGAAGVTNRQFSAGTTAFSSAFTAITDNEMYWGTATPHRFYAYYPYSASAGSDATLVPVTLAAAQTQSAGNSSAHIGNYDFMVATPVTGATPGTAGEATTVNLRYNHVFSILEFQIINATGTISEIKLSGNGPLSLTSGTIDITQTTPVNAATTYTISSPVYGSEITLTTAAITTTADYVTTPKIYMMVLPKSITGYLDIAIKIGDAYKFIRKEVTSASGGFDRGQKYKVQIDASTATDYPGTTLAQVNIGGLYWAPVNAGYITTTRPYGLMYQWGRKYGQEYVGTGSVAGPVAISVGNNPANVANFYTNSSNVTEYDWCTPQVTSWTTTYTPCPAGWRVPTAIEMTALNTAGSTWVAAAGGNPDGLAGRWFGSTSDSPTTVKNIFLPAAGMRTNQDGALYSRDSYGSYWSSVASTRADNLQFYSSGSASMSVSGGAYGMTVRCVKTLTGS